MGRTKTFLIILLALLISPLAVFSADGDTITYQGHQQTHVNWYGNYDQKVGFDNTDQSYEKVLMEFIIECPSTGCSEWDYFMKVSSRVKTGETDTNHTYDSNGVLSIDTFDLYEETELARYITPYAGNVPDGWKRKYIYDVSDFQSVLKDSTIIRLFMDGWQDGWVVSTNFLFVEGKPSRNVLGYQNLWTGRYTYGETANPISDQVLAQTVTIPSEAKQAKLRVLTTGHRFGGAENCAEFCIKTHEFHINGTKAYDQLLWRNDCGMNPEYPQAGTWLYDRAGWCPGAPVASYDYDLTSYLTGSEMTVDYQFDDYQWDDVNPPAPSYYIGSAVVFYGDPNFNKDAEVTEIISPNSDFIYNRFNPICNDPVIVIENNGSEAMTNATINFGLEGLTALSFEWTGNLAYLEKDTVVLSVNEDRAALWAGADSNSVFFAEIDKVNGDDDEYASNDRKQANIALPPVYPSTFYVRFKTNNAANETHYRIYDQNDSIVYGSYDSLEERTTYDTLVNFEVGCYVLEVWDDGKDGTDFWANNDGKGKLELRTDDYIGTADIKAFDMDFGTRFYHHFRVGYTLNTPELEKNGFYLAPNPSNGLVWLSYESNEPYEIEVFSLLGQKLMTKTGQSSVERLDLGQWKGQYVWIRVSNQNDQLVRKLMIH